MEIGGFQPVSLIDYPGKVTCIVFTIGCNFRCPFCYVPQLVLPERAKRLKKIPEEEILAYLEKNRELIDGVVITGGEPTLQKDLEQFIRKIKGIKDFSIAIESNGSNPDTLQDLINKGLVDHVSIDIKNVLEYSKYSRASKLSKKNFENVKRSIQIAKSISHEFRTTIVKGIHTESDIKELCDMFKDENYFLQKFKRPGPLVGGDKSKAFKPYEKNEIEQICPGTRYRE